MTAAFPTFRAIQVAGHPPADPDRLTLFNLWFDATVRDGTLVADGRWLRLGVDIISGRSLIPWVSQSEFEPPDLPDNAPDTFLDELDALVEDEEGTDLQHLSWMDA